MPADAVDLQVLCKLSASALGGYLGRKKLEISDQCQLVQQRSG